MNEYDTTPRFGITIMVAGTYPHRDQETDAEGVRAFLENLDGGLNMGDGDLVVIARLRPTPRATPRAGTTVVRVEVPEDDDEPLPPELTGTDLAGDHDVTDLRETS